MITFFIKVIYFLEIITMFRKSILFLTFISLVSCDTTQNTQNEKSASSLKSGTAERRTGDAIIQQDHYTSQQPKGSNSSYKEITACDGRLFLIIPRELKIMTQEKINVKFPRLNSRPDEAFANDEFNVNIGLHLLKEPLSPNTLPSFGSSLVSQLTGKVEGLRSNIEKINGYNYFIVEFSNAQAYSLMFITDIDGFVFIGKFECVLSLTDEWKPKGMEIISSLRKL